MTPLNRLISLSLLLLALCTTLAGAQPYGIATREPNTSILINNLPPSPGTMTAVRQFGTLAFTNPLGVTSCGDGSGRLFVIEQAGYIREFDPGQPGTPTTNLFLDIHSKVASGGELGLLGLAFDPDYATNGYFYVYYTRYSSPLPFDDVLARYTNPNPSANSADPNSELILFAQQDTENNHNGGQLAFGNDGYLYVSLGDGGLQNDGQDSAQNLTTFLGKILRLDVHSTPDPGKNYHVPGDNPFLFGSGPSPVIMESRQPDGSLTSIAQGYSELGAPMANSTLKSSFSGSGLTGTGSRASADGNVNARVRFTPTLVDGLYDIYVTTTNNSSANAPAATYTIVNAGQTETFKVDLTSSNTGNKWTRIRRNVPFHTGTVGYIEISGVPGNGGSFFSDAVRFVRVNPAPEIYAFGFRNPWRFSVDRVTGAIWIGDVGQSNREEIDLLKKGGNYGWREIEGNICTPNYFPGCQTPGTCCDATGTILPIRDYSHPPASAPTGYAIIGGFVYRGSQYPGLYGKYLYSDNWAGFFYALDYNGSTVLSNTALVASSSLSPSAFGERENGELLICSLANGGLYALNPTTPPPPSDLPLKISDNPALFALSRGTQQAGILPFQPQQQFWTDGAIKKRFLAIPGVQNVGYTPSGGWDFPDHTTVIKNISLRLDEDNPASETLVETRLLIKNSSLWYGYSYRWRDDQSDADLLTGADTRTLDISPAGGGPPLHYTWQFPSSLQCQQCHTGAANYTLGLQTLQMNHDYLYPASGVTDNQLRTLDHIGLFSPALPGPPASLPYMPPSSDTSASLLARVKSYFQSNCAQCHQPGGGAQATIDFRYDTALADMDIVNSVPRQGDLGVPGARLVTPGDPSKSVVYLRMLSLGSERMPPLTSSRVDTEGAALVAQWIQSLTASSTPDGWETY